MSEQFTTYTVTGKGSNIVWLFKYRLNGLLAKFELLEGELDDKQVNWLFIKGKFPYKEQQIKGWKAIKNFDIKTGEPDLSFETFWAVYSVKQKRTVAEKLWEKLSKKDKIEALKAIPRYNNWLAHKNGIQKQLPDTFLRQQRWLDNFNEL